MSAGGVPATSFSKSICSASSRAFLLAPTSFPPQAAAQVRHLDRGLRGFGPLGHAGTGLLHRVAGQEAESDRHARLPRERGERARHRVPEDVVMSRLTTDDRAERDQGVRLFALEESTRRGGQLERSRNAHDERILGAGSAGLESSESRTEKRVRHGRVPTRAEDAELQAASVEASRALTGRERWSDASHGSIAQGPVPSRRWNSNPRSLLPRRAARAETPRRSFACSDRRTLPARNAAAAARETRARARRRRSQSAPPLPRAPRSGCRAPGRRDRRRRRRWDRPPASPDERPEPRGALYRADLRRKRSSPPPRA